MNCTLFKDQNNQKDINHQLFRFHKDTINKIKYRLRNGIIL